MERMKERLWVIDDKSAKVQCTSGVPEEKMERMKERPYLKND